MHGREKEDRFQKKRCEEKDHPEEEKCCEEGLAKIAIFFIFSKGGSAKEMPGRFFVSCEHVASAG
jgi:hypothetical protein